MHRGYCAAISAHSVFADLTAAATQQENAHIWTIAQMEHPERGLAREIVWAVERKCGYYGHIERFAGGNEGHLVRLGAFVDGEKLMW